MPEDFTNTVTVGREPLETHSRYVLVYEDAPALTTIHGMIEHRADEGLLGILVIANDCTSEPVQVEQEDDGTWIVYQISVAGENIEEIRYTETGEVEHHEVFVPGFTTDQVPMFTAGV